MRIVGCGSYGDQHAETDWYDYEEEVVEPVPPLERNVGLKVVKRNMDNFDIEMLDTELLDLPKSPLKRRKKSRKSTDSKVSGRDSRTSFRARTMVIFDQSIPDMSSTKKFSTIKSSLYKKSKVVAGGATIGTGTNFSDALSATLKSKKTVKRGGGDLSSRVGNESELPEPEPM